MVEILPHNESPVVRKHRWLHMIVLGGLVVPVFLIAVISAGLWGYVAVYSGKVYPGVQVAGYELGGLSRAEVKTFIENINNKYAKEGIGLEVTNASRGEAKVVVPTITGGDSAIQVATIDSDELSGAAIGEGRTGMWWEMYINPIAYRFAPVALDVPVHINASVLASVLKDSLQGFEDKYHNAELQVVRVSTGETKIKPEVSGRKFDYEQIASEVRAGMAAFSFAPIKVELQHFTPTITAADIAQVAPKVQGLLNDSALKLAVATSTVPEQLWEITPADLAPMLVVEKDAAGEPIITVDKQKFFRFLDIVVRPSVEVAPKDAKFEIVDNKMKEFQVSKNGARVNEEATFAALRDVVVALNNTGGAATSTVPVTVDVVAPNIKTADIEGLGITEIIGAGTSTFRDSHTNRIKNIANAVKRLNGTIIAPGEIFSANKYAGPYTPENGFLPEQVIKGREIKPEVGGGMCQIGTTLFRMAMNTGLPITERTNHSLVVSYYADPVNGNPGTDATLYEPILDLKFENDTGNYMLLLTEINYKKQMLTFTLWGKPDGRTGSYTHPKVSKWIPYPPEVQYVAQTDPTKLEVGKMTCQAAFRGAVASFTYSRTTPSGEKIDRVFDSYYRPLPKICTIGVDPATCPAGKPCVVTSSSIPVVAP